MDRAGKIGRGEQGFAIITVLLVVMAVSVIAATLLARQYTEVTSTGRFVSYMQAWQYALGAEIRARQVLARDLKEDAELDHPKEAWAQSAVFSVPGGEVRLRIEDAETRLNLNALLTGEGGAAGPWEKLCELSGISPETATGVEKALVAAFTEEDVYMQDASQLMDYGLTRTQYRQVQDAVAALPTAEAPVNANTASARVLAAVLGSEAKAQALLDKREAGPLLKTDLESSPGLRAWSSHFTVSAEVVIDGEPYRLRAGIERLKDKQGGASFRTLYRDW